MAKSVNLADSPIRSEKEDLFGRAAFAENLSTLILGFPAGTSHRLGVYGEWGSGKTSVLELIAASVREAGYPSIWLLPWALGSVDALVDRLLEELARCLGVGPSSWKKLSRAARKSAAAAEAAEGVDIRLTLAMRAAKPILEGTAKRLKTRHGTGLLEAISERLRSSKVVVFVDDLDRTSPSRIPSMLLMLQEGLSLPNVHYVFGLSPEIVRKGLVTSHPEWAEEPQDFLDRIVEYPFALPPLEEQAVLRATSRLISEDASFPHTQPLLELGEHLPQNPRRLKLFLRLVGSLAGQLTRYSANEIDLRRALLIQMLRLEFPTESLALARDKNAVRNIEDHFAKGLVRGRRNIEEGVDKPEERFAPEKPQLRNRRFLALCDAIRERDSLRSELGFVQLFHLLDRPPVLTWKELQELLEAAQQGDEVTWRGRLDSILNKPDIEDARQSALAVWQKAVQGRERIWSAAIDADTRAEILEGLELLSALDELIRDLAITRKLFHRGVLRVDDWQQLWNYLADWDRFTQLPEYLDVRRRERALLTDIAAELPSRTQADAWLQMSSRDRSGVGSEDYEALRASLLERFQGSAVGLALDRFRMSEGVDLFWGRNEWTPEKQVVFDPNSQFHKGEARETLTAIAAEAADLVDIQMNFLTYMRMLLYGLAGGASSFPAEGCRVLLGDSQLLDSVWQAATARPLNPRVVGSLREQLSAPSTEALELAFPTVPGWWRAIEASVFPDEEPIPPLSDG